MSFRAQTLTLNKKKTRVFVARAPGLDRQLKHQFPMYCADDRKQDASPYVM